MSKMQGSDRANDDQKETTRTQKIVTAFPTGGNTTKRDKERGGQDLKYKFERIKLRRILEMYNKKIHVLECPVHGDNAKR